MTRNGIQRKIINLVLGSAVIIIMTGCSTSRYYESEFDWNDKTAGSEAETLRKKATRMIKVKFVSKTANVLYRTTKKWVLHGDRWGELIINGGLVAKFHKFHAPEEMMIPLQEGENTLKVQYMRKRFGSVRAEAAQGIMFWVHNDFKDPTITISVYDGLSHGGWVCKVLFHTGYEIYAYNKWSASGSGIGSRIRGYSEISQKNDDFSRKPLSPPMGFKHEKKRYKYGN